MADGDLTTLTQVKGMLGLPSTPVAASDSVLDSLISATSADFLRAIERTDFLAADYTETRIGDGGPWLVLRHRPINSVASVTIAGVAVAASPDGVASGYNIIAETDPERIRLLTMSGGAVFTDGASVAVTYNGGYATVPLDVAQAVADWVVRRWRSRPAVGVSSQRDAGGEHVTYDAEAPMPSTTQGVADRYARPRPSTNKRQEDRDQRVTRINRTITEKAR